MSRLAGGHPRRGVALTPSSCARSCPGRKTVVWFGVDVTGDSNLRADPLRHPPAIAGPCISRTPKRTIQFANLLGEHR